MNRPEEYPAALEGLIRLTKETVEALEQGELSPEDFAVLEGLIRLTKETVEALKQGELSPQNFGQALLKVLQLVGRSQEDQQTSIRDAIERILAEIQEKYGP